MKFLVLSIAMLLAVSACVVVPSDPRPVYAAPVYPYYPGPSLGLGLYGGGHGWHRGGHGAWHGHGGGGHGHH